MPTRKTAAAVAALLALGDILWVGAGVLAWQDTLWPLPGLYLLEWLALAGLTLWAVLRADPHWHPLPWGAAGIMLAFNGLGIFSIGIPLLPATLGFLLAGALMPHRPPARWLLLIPATALLQAALMLLLVDLR